MRIYNLSIGTVNKAAKMLRKSSKASLSECNKIIAQSVGYKDDFDLRQNGKIKADGNDIPDAQLIEAEIEITVKISSQLEISPVTAHHILSNTLFHKGLPPNIGHALKVIAGAFERTVLPQQGWRKSGQIGRLKSPGRNGEQVILREYGRAARVINHASADCLVADFEYIGSKKPLPLFIPMYLYMPYGVWTERDGSRVLFSRDYFPMWRLREGKTPERLDPWERIDFSHRSWILPEGQMSWSTPKNSDFCLHILEREGIKSFPRLLDALPLIVNDTSVGSGRDVAEKLKAMSSKETEKNVREPT